MGQSSSTEEGQVLSQQYESSLNLFTTYEQGELKKIFDKICQMSSSSPGTAASSSPSKKVIGFKENQLQVCIALETSVLIQWVISIHTILT